MGWTADADGGPRGAEAGLSAATAEGLIRHLQDLVWQARGGGR